MNVELFYLVQIWSLMEHKQSIQSFFFEWTKQLMKAFNSRHLWNVFMLCLCAIKQECWLFDFISPVWEAKCVITAYISLNSQVGYYLVQNRIIVGRWMRMNWYTLASRQVLFEARLGCWWMIIEFWNSFNHTTHLFNEPCSKHALVAI